MTFSTELDAARHLLADSTAALRDHGVNFVVVGGWSALLFHSSKYGHPGTFDVDILLHERSLDDGTFDRASEALLKSGYLRAPKNMYQAHRILHVAGEDFVFHVDFLNERDPGNAIQLVGGKGRMKSIYTEAMKAVFKYQGYREHPQYPGVRFPSPETFVVTKAAAAVVRKRARDAFDVFVTVSDQPRTEFTHEWAALCAGDGLFSDANEALSHAVYDGDAIDKIVAVLEDMHAAGQLNEAMPDRAQIRSLFSFLVGTRRVGY